MGGMNIDEAIRVEQARLIHRNVPAAVIGGFVVVCLVVAVFSRVVPTSRLVIWMAAIALLSLYRLGAWWKFRQPRFTFPVAQAWMRHAMLGAGLSGVLWGAGALLLSPPAGAIDYQLTFVWAVVMMSAAAMFSFSAHFPMFLAFCLPSALPLAFDLVTKNTPLHWGIAGGMVLFAGVAVRFMWTFNQVFIESLKLRFENTQLVAKLTIEKENAEMANLAKSRFLAIASHDLRQPMHAMNLYLGSLAGIDLSERARALLVNVRQCARAMDDMFRALLDISRLDAGSVQPDIQVFNVATVLDRLRIEFEPQARAKGLELRVARCSASVRSDPALVERILRNFAANAVDHSESGRILIGARRRGERLRLAVYDLGPGIPPDQQGKVFAEFYQLGNPERDRSKGLGLGLAIVDRLARLLAAQVTLSSRIGGGSMFAVDLPRAHEAAAAVASPFPAPARRQDLSGLLVVVVDDEDAILQASRTLLEQWGCTVVTAASGSQALERLSSSTRVPDALLCDYRLRDGENGIGVIEALRAEFNEDIPGVLITGDTAPDRIRETEASGLLVLHKPLDEDKLRDALFRVLGPRTVSSGLAA